jgi:uncharacterized membrane protein
MTFQDTMDTIAKCVEAIGVAIIAVGIVISLTRAGLECLQRQEPTAVYRRTRSFLGRSLLLGLEVLVAADLIRTVAVDPSLENVGVLGLIVLIRTFLSFSLDIEIDRRLPWKPGPEAATDVASG